MKAFTQIRVRYLLILILLGISIVPAAAQKEVAMPEITIEPVWGGLVRTPGWSELQVTINNEGSDWEGELVLLDIDNEITYRLALELPAHSNKHYRLPIFMDSQQEIKASLRSEHGDGQTYQVKFTQGAEQRTCVIADSSRTFILKDTNCNQKLYLDNLSQLPETAMAWDAIDVLIINGVSSAELTSAQQESLLAWVAIGGHLVVGGGPALAQSLAGLPAEMQIATVANTRIVRNLTFGTEVAAEVAATTLLSQTEFTTLLQDQNDLLAARANVGEGYVDVLGWDLKLAEGQLWLPSLWTADPIPATRIWNNEDTVSTAYLAPTTSLLEVPSSKVPLLWQWMLLFPIYILAISAGTYIITNRLQRPTLAWALIPAWSILALLTITFILSGIFSRRYPLVHEIATIHVSDPALPARVVQGSAVYAPRTHQLSWTHTGAPRPLAGRFMQSRGRYGLYDQVNPFSIESSYLERGSSMQVRNPIGVITWGTEGVYSAPQISHNLVLATTETEQPELSGNIYSDVELHNVMLDLDNGVHKLWLTDTVSSADKTYVSQTIFENSAMEHLCDHPYYYSAWSPRSSIETEDSAPPLDDDTCHIIAEIDQVPFPMQGIAGTHVAESCLIYAVPCPQLASGAGEFDLIPNKLTLKNGWINQVDYLTIAKPGTTLAFTQPDFHKIQDIEKLTIDLTNDYKDYPFELNELFLWDWENETWIPVPLPAASPIVISGEAAARAFDIERGIHLKLIPVNNGADFFINVKVAGTW